MDSGGGVVTIVLPILMLLAALVTQLASSGHLPRNGLIGIRIRSTRASDQAWRTGHRAAVVPTWAGFAAVTIVGIISWSFAGTVASQALWAGVSVLLVIVFVTWSLIAASRAVHALTTS